MSDYKNFILRQEIQRLKAELDALIRRVKNLEEERSLI